MQNHLFDFMKDETYRLMLDMAKETQDEKSVSDICARFKKADIKKLFQACEEHEFVGVVGYFAISHGLELSQEWKAAYDREKKHLDFLKSKSREICSLMKKSGIPMVILKNGGIMQDIMPEAIQCPMEDIDSLIRKKDFYKAHEILIQNGFTFKFRSEYEAEKLDEAFRDGSTEYFIMTPYGEKMWFELAWRAVAGRWIRPDLEPDTDMFIKNAHCAMGTDVYVLSPEDNLLQVCIHTAKHSYVRAPGLRLHIDVDRIVSHTKIDWKKFIEKVNMTHVRTSTYLSLYIPTVLFGTAVPTWVLDALKPSNANKLIKMLEKAELLHPHGRKFSKMEFLRFQTGLYDGKTDVLKVIYPSKAWMQERYGCKNGVQLVKCTVARGLDLVGIRKKK